MISIHAATRILTFLVMLLPIAASAKGSHGHGGVTHVRAYTKKSGRRVEKHARTAENSTQKDNWSAAGNVNAETGKKGYKKPKH